MPSREQSFGAAGETLALALLLRKGYRLLAQHASTRWGEVDLILEEGNTVVFVEVKRRTRLWHHRPEEAVGRSKQGKLIRSALTLVQQRGWQDKMLRFDVVSAGPDGVLHFADAFDAGAAFYH